MLSVSGMEFGKILNETVYIPVNTGNCSSVSYLYVLDCCFSSADQWEIYECWFRIDVNYGIFCLNMELMSC